MPRPAVPSDRRRKPVAGFPSQAAACAALAKRGLSPEEIGRKIGRDTYHVRAQLRRLSEGVKARSFVLPVRLARALEGAAAAREISEAELATRLLDVVINDDLFDALLGEPGGADV